MFWSEEIQEVEALTKESALPGGETIAERNEGEATSEPAGKKLFVEPTVSSATDVLEATTFFQAPTIESSTI